MHDQPARTADQPTRTDDQPADKPQGGEAEANETSADVVAPFAPHEDDDSPLGDSDQHSTA